MNFLGCHGQGTSETSYLCKPCFAEQQNMRQNANMRNKINHHQPHDDNVLFPGKMFNTFISLMFYLKDFWRAHQN